MRKIIIILLFTGSVASADLTPEESQWLSDIANYYMPTAAEQDVTHSEQLVLIAGYAVGINLGVWTLVGLGCGYIVYRAVTSMLPR